MSGAFLNVGYGNFILASKIVAIISPESAPIKRTVQNIRDSVNLIDATFGRRTRSVVFLDNKQVLLSALQPETLVARLSGSNVCEEEL